MPTSLARIVALLLIPCLLINPVPGGAARRAESAAGLQAPNAYAYQALAQTSWISRPIPSIQSAASLVKEQDAERHPSSSRYTREIAEQDQRKPIDIFLSDAKRRRELGAYDGLRNVAGIDRTIAIFMLGWEGKRDVEQEAYLVAFARNAGSNSPLALSFHRAIIDFANTAYTNNNPDAQIFLWKLGKIVAEQATAGDAAQFSERWVPLRQFDPAIEGLYSLDLAAGPNAAIYLQSMRTVLVDRSYLVEGLLDRLKDHLNISHDVIIRRADILQPDSYLLEASYKEIRLFNVEAYVPNCLPRLGPVLWEKVAMGGYLTFGVGVGSRQKADELMSLVRQKGFSFPGSEISFDVVDNSGHDKSQWAVVMSFYKKPSPSSSASKSVDSRRDA